MKAQLVILASVVFPAGCGESHDGKPTIAGAQQSPTEDEAPPQITAPSPRRIVGSNITEATLNVGQAQVTESQSPGGRYAAVFEDDGDTGWYFALDRTRPGNPIADGMHVYNGDDVVDRDQPSQLQIIWSPDGLKAALFINSYPHAVYDFEAMRGSCRSGAGASTTQGSYEWDDAQLEHFYEKD